MFKRVDGDPNWLHFEDIEHEFPIRVEYNRDGDKLMATVAGRAKDGNVLVSL